MPNVSYLGPRDPMRIAGEESYELVKALAALDWLRQILDIRPRFIFMEGNRAHAHSVPVPVSECRLHVDSMARRTDSRRSHLVIAKAYAFSSVSAQTADVKGVLIFFLDIGTIRS